MFAMFHCGRPDILPVGDLAVRKGFQTLYGLPAPPSVEEMEALAEPWRPYRSLGRCLPGSGLLSEEKPWMDAEPWRLSGRRPKPEFVVSG